MLYVITGFFRSWAKACRPPAYPFVLKQILTPVLINPDFKYHYSLFVNFLETIHKVSPMFSLIISYDSNYFFLMLVLNSHSKSILSAFHLKIQCWNNKYNIIFKHLLFISFEILSYSYSPYQA